MAKYAFIMQCDSDISPNSAHSVNFVRVHVDANRAA